MRLVLNMVGQPLNGFNITKVLTRAFEDAIKGHRQVYTIGILHRDVSEGNILLQVVDGQPFKGMLVDFDYTSFRLEAIAELDSEEFREFGLPDEPDDMTDEALYASVEANLKKRHEQNLVQAINGSEVLNELKERTGTLRFMAIAFLDLGNEEVVHRVQHDLESFFWVLVWVVLRRTRYSHPDGPQTCDKLFGGANERACKSAKIKWFNLQDWVMVKNNRPLTALLSVLNELVRDAYNKSEPLTYDSVLEVSEEALLMNGWPADDKFEGDLCSAQSTRPKKYLLGISQT